MSRFNLLDEPWISVIRSGNGIQTEMSVTELFRNASEIQCLTGDTETQNFAVLRMLLAILQTVFSRYDADGEPIVPVDENMIQTEEIEDDEEERDDYEEALEETWSSIWGNGAFPDVLFRYLNMWRDHFFLLDDRYPFYQVTQKTLKEILPQDKKATSVAGRFMNRTISESGHKIALFSPRASGDGNTAKDVMSAAELARWLITFQGYTGLSDKTSIVKKDQKPSKGWLFDIGGICLEGENLFETLMLNSIPVHPEEDDRYNIQKPCWEFSDADVIKRLRNGLPITNLAELYTNWSRAVYLDPEIDLPGTASVQIVKVPAIRHTDQFLEPMTVWKYNEKGDNKGHFTPRKHLPEQAMWRSYGLIVLPTSAENRQKQPGILTRMDQTRSAYGSRIITVCAISMQDDGNATSWVPIDEITDKLRLNDLILTDSSDDGWVIRISDTVRETREIVDVIYKKFLRDIAEIRHMDEVQAGGFFRRETGELYQDIDEPFRRWLLQIDPEDSKEKKIMEWKQRLKKIVKWRAQAIVQQAGSRDFTGIERDGHTLNVATAYRDFVWKIDRKIGREERV